MLIYRLICRLSCKNLINKRPINHAINKLKITDTNRSLDPCSVSVISDHVMHDVNGRSISPWVECIVISLGASHTTTVDYNTPMLSKDSGEMPMTMLSMSDAMESPEALPHHVPYM